MEGEKERKRYTTRGETFTRYLGTWVIIVRDGIRQTKRGQDSPTAPLFPFVS